MQKKVLISKIQRAKLHCSHTQNVAGYKMSQLFITGRKDDKFKTLKIAIGIIKKKTQTRRTCHSSLFLFRNACTSESTYCVLTLGCQVFLRTETFKEIMVGIARRTQVISKKDRICQQIETKPAVLYGILLTQNRNPSMDTGKMLLLKAGKACYHTSEFIFSRVFPIYEHQWEYVVI